MRHISDYGAAGDGKSDDTAAFQAMLDDGPGACSIAGVNLRISAPVIIRGGRRLLAHGARVTGTGGHTLLRNFVIDVDSFPGYTGHGDIGVYGGTWDARGDLAAPGGPHEGEAWNAITFCHAERVVTDGLAIERVSTYHALEYNAVRHGRITGIVARGFIDAFGRRAFSEAIQIDLAKERSSDIGDFDRTHAQDVRIDSCYAGPLPDGAMGPFGALVGSHVSEGGRYEGIWVRDCTVENPLMYGVHGYGWDAPVVRGNRIIGAGAAAVRLEHGVGGIVEGNVITGAGVDVDGQDGAIVTGNQITP